ncbi:GAF domain-containing protein [uncultured Chloroflexus sp.]|uniref:GAF domain-containing protein n=1 Tax=uncultured Chloroflexus sp. TaxID=214040 RepID=UPI0026367FBB|nr:GAF domain-containing protein [uncultured Chloroflexus sp.]
MTRTARRRQLIGDLERQRDALRRQQERDQQILAALYAIGLAARSRPSLRVIFETIVHELHTVFDFDACYLAFCDERPERFKAALLYDEGQIDFLENREYGYLTGMIVRRREPMLFRDLLVERDPSLPPVPFGNTAKLSRSWIGVPLMISEAVVGVISLQSYQPNLYTHETLELLQRIANVIALALENAVLVEDQERLSRTLTAQLAARREELAALSALASTLVDPRSLDELLDQALAIAMRTLHFEAGNVRLLDSTGTLLVLRAQRGFSTEYIEQTRQIPLEISPLREVVTQMQPRIVSREWYAQYDPATFPLHLFPRFESTINLPLVVGRHVLGTLSFFGFTPREIAPHELALAQSVANQIAILVEHSRLTQERERQIAELRAMREISLAASTTQTARDLLQRTAIELQSCLAFDVFSMVIYDPERHLISDGITLDEGQLYTYWISQPPPPRSLTARILRERQPIFLRDLPVEIRAWADVDNVIIGTERAARSWMGWPLLDRDGRAIGMVSVQSYRSHAFTPRDMEFLGNVAAQLALHVQNVTLLAQRARQIAELQAINQIGTLVAASYDLNRILNETRQIVVDLTAASVFYLLLCDPHSRLVRYAVFVEHNRSLGDELVGRRTPPDSLTDWLLTHRQPLRFDDLMADRQRIDEMGIKPYPIGSAHLMRSWVGVTILAHHEEAIGVIVLQDERPYQYDNGTIDFLAQIVSLISLAVQKVQLFEERERQAHENARLFEAAQAHAVAAEQQAARMALVNRIAGLLAARLDQQAILDIAARELVQLFWADHTGLVLFHDDETGEVVAEYPPTGILGMTIDLRHNLLIKSLCTTRRPQMITDIETDPRAMISRDRWREMGLRSLVVVPLISRDRVFGSISFDSFGEPRSYSEEELDLMMTVTTSVATAYENALLFAAEQEQRRTAETLREVARVLSSSFDPNEVLQLVLAELRKVINYDTATIMLIDDQVLRIVAASGWPPEEMPRGKILPLAGSGAGQVVRERRPILVVAPTDGTIWPPGDIGERILTWLGVPLISKGRVLGVLNIDSYRRYAFTERDLDVALAFANHAALAIENAQLYQESVARVEQELAIARQIQSNLFPRELPVCPGLSVAARCLPARETGGDFYDVIDLGSRIGVIVGDVSGKSLPAAMLMAVARSTARSEARNHELPRLVLAETNRWLVDDVPRHAFVALGYALIDPIELRLTLANAGQLAPLLRHADGRTTFLETAGALPLGVQRDTRYNQIELVLAPGDTVVFYTDGIVEAQNAQRELFGFDRLEQLVRHWGYLPPEALLDRLLAEVQAFSEGRMVHDDMTLVVVRVE